MPFGWDNGPEDTARCPRCSQSMAFVPQAFAFVCPSCGALDIDTNSFDDRPTEVLGDTVRSSKNRYQSLTAKQVFSGLASISQLSETERLLKAEHVRALAGRILSSFDSAHLAAQVDSILLQWTVLRTEKRTSSVRTIGAPLIAAACFVALKMNNSAMSTDIVASASQLSELSVKRALQDIEGTLVDSGLVEVSRDTPHAFLDPQIHYLLSLVDVSVELNEGLAPLAVREARLLSVAKLDSEAFIRSAEDLTTLCTRHGLYNRSSTRGQKLDLSLCSFAILIHCIEAKTCKPCNEAAMADLAVHAPGWRIGQKAGVTKVELDLPSGSDRDSQIFDGKEPVLKEERARSTAATIRETVKRRYVEISRMLTLYIRALPWFVEESPGRRMRTANKSKVAAHVKADIYSIRPLPRSVIVKHLPDILTLADSLHFKVEAMLEREYHLPPTSATLWSRFWATELHFNNTRQTATGQCEIERRTQSGQLQDQPASSIGCLNSMSPLHLHASRNVPILTSEALEQMTDEVVDKLLFESGEMDTYFRTPAEIEQIRLLFGLDHTVQSTGKRKQSPTTVEPAEAMLRHSLETGKRTKALDDSDFERIMSQL